MSDTVKFPVIRADTDANLARLRELDRRGVLVTDRTYPDMALVEDGPPDDDPEAEALERKAWDESLHPREPKGSEAGGQFTSGAGAGGAGGGKDGEGGKKPGGADHPHGEAGEAGDLGASEGAREATEFAPRYTRPVPIQVDDIDQAVRMIARGEVVELKEVRQVNTLLKKLAGIAAEAKRLGKDAPNYNLCLVSVAGTNLFCRGAETVDPARFPGGIPRLKMPQLGGRPVPGSTAETLPRNPWDPTEVDGSAHFVAHLRALGIGVATGQTASAASLKASQAELVGAKVAAMMVNPKFQTGANPLFVSRDGYVIDGHHRWAAIVGRDAESGKLGGLKVHVTRVDAPIAEILHLAVKWADAFGIAPAAAKRARGGVAKEVIRDRAAADAVVAHLETISADGEYEYEAKAAQKGAHAYATVQAVLPPGAAQLIAEWQRLHLQPFDNAELEATPHVTVRYGLLPSVSCDAAAAAVRNGGPLTLSVGGLGVFEGVEGGTRDCLVAWVASDGDELERLNAALGRLPHDDTQAGYVPHLTLAFVPLGAGEDVLDRIVEGPAFTFSADHLEWRGVDGESAPLPIAPRLAYAGLEGELDEDAE